MSEYVNNWHRVWSNRQHAINQDLGVSPLHKLISLDGFDSPLGTMAEGDWNAYLSLFAQRCGLESGDSIFEVGCGSGAFLFPLWLRGHPVGGLDYSSELVLMAQYVMPGSVIYAQEATQFSDDEKSDHVIANHVIHYFSSLDYIVDPDF